MIRCFTRAPGRAATAGEGRLRRGAVWGTAAVLLVGGCGNGGEDEDAARWRLDYVSTSRDASVHDLAVVSADEGWAVATQTGRDGTDHAHLLHRDGDDWRRADMPALLRPDKGAELASAELEASGPEDVWLFGHLGSEDTGAQGLPGAARFDGERWRKTSVDFSVRDVAVITPDDVWALDSSTPEPVAHHWDGRRWSRHRLPAEGYFDSLAATGPDDVWAAGRLGNPSDEAVPQPGFVHFDGEEWQPVPAPEYRHADPKLQEEARLMEIVALSPEQAWAFGSHSHTSTSGAGVRHTAFALRWNGSRWQKAPKALDTSGRKLPSESAMVGAGDGAGGFVLGSAFGSEQHHTADGALHTIKDPDPVAGRSDDDTGGPQHLEVYDLQHVPGTQEVWAAGAVGTGLLHGEEAAFSRGVVASYRPTAR